MNKQNSQNWIRKTVAVLAAILLATGALAGVSPSSGPFGGGTSVNITGGDLGSGADITNVTVCGVVAAIQSQSSNSVTVIVGAAGSGVGDVVVQSTSKGDTTYPGSYTYNPQGYISGDVLRWVSVSNFPVARGMMAAAAAGGRIYAMGGYNYGWNTTAYSHDTATSTQGWQSVSSLPVASGCLAAVSVGGKIYSIGGQNGVVNFSQVYVYDPIHPELGWGSISNMPLPLGWLAAAVAHEKIYVMGGDTAGGTESGVYEYDPEKPTQGWRFVNNMPAPRNGLAAVEVNGIIYAIGGSYNGECQSSVWAFDPLSPEEGWQSISSIPEARALLCAVSLGGKIVVMGGRTTSSTSGTASVYVYDPSQPAQGWLTASDMPAGKVESPAVVVNGKIFNISGATASLTYTPAVYEGSFTVGVSPVSGSVCGGTTVSINGSNLGNGSDITSVTLCGVPVSAILSQSATQVVVTTGPAAVPQVSGHVCVYSTSYGLTTASNAFTYILPPPVSMEATEVTLRGFSANWSAVTGAENYRLDVSTSTGFVTCVANYSNLNVGAATSWAVAGLNAASSYYYRVRAQSAGLTSVSSAPQGVTTLSGVLSLTNGPYSGGNTLTITGAGLGNGSDITNVVVGGVVATIIGQTTNSVTVVLGAGGGTATVVIQSASAGMTLLPNAYNYNPAGIIFGVAQDWSRWEEVAGLPAARDRLAAGVLNGQLYAVGGQSGSIDRTNMFRYNGSNWVEVTGLPVARSALAVATFNNALYAMGGSGSSNVFCFNGVNWAEVAGLPANRHYLSAAVLNSSLYNLGGGPPGPVNVQTNVYRYNGTNWIEVAGSARRGNVAVGVLDGYLYAAGGTSDGLIQHTNVYRYDGVSWSEVAGLPAPREGMGSGVLNGSFYVFGGYYSASGNPGTGVQQTNTYRFNGANWTEVAGLPAPRGLMGSAQYNGAIYAIGGMMGVNTSLSAMRTNVYRYPALGMGAGVSPSSGPMAGGTTVTINGSDLGNGSDITNVEICGIAASVVSQSATQIVVMTGASAVPLINGAVCVYSTSYGLTSRESAYSYTGSLYQVVSSAGPNGSITPSGAVPVMEGLSTNFTVQAGGGHHIAEVFVDGVPVGLFGPTNTSFVYAMSGVTSNRTIRAVFNTPPVIGVTVSPTNGVAPLRVLYDFTPSSDMETNMVRCEVDKEGDGLYETTGDGAGRLIVEYGAPGLYLSSARVIDAYGASSSTVIPVTVWGIAPAASLQAAPVSDPAPLTVTFTATNSVAAPGHQIVVYEWDFDGNGMYDLISCTGFVSHVYRVPGIFTATLRVTDDQGLQDKATVTITVAQPTRVPPSVTLQASPEVGTIPLPVSFTTVVSNDQPVVEYRWDFDGDGVVDLLSASGSASHTYSAVGTYQASVTVVDNAGLSGRATTTVTTREASTLRVWIVQPKATAQVSGSAVSVNANAVPASQVASVQFRYRANAGEWVNIGGPLVPPPADFKTTWCVTNLADGTVCDLQAIATDINSAVVTSEVVSVTVNASAGKVPGAVTEGDKDGKHNKQATFSTNETAQIDVYDGTSVTIPVGAVESNVTVEVELTGTNVNLDTGVAYGRMNINVNRKVTLDGHPDLSQPITITLPYPDVDNDGLVDGTSVPESTLSASWFDTSDGKWKKPLSCEVDTVANLVRITTYHLTEFGLYGSRNLLHPASGGLLADCTFVGAEATAAANLTDGNTASYWVSPTNPTPQEFVYTFTNYQGAICAEAVLYNYGQAAAGLTNYSKDYQILVSMDGVTFTNVASGTLAMSESPVSIDMGSVTCRVVKLVITSGYGDVSCLAEFELHGTMTDDPNGNGMVDAWEMNYFHTLSRTGTDDYDKDALSDLNEFIHGSNPSTNDTDGDGMTDGWEVQYGFQVATNDAAIDLDGDRMSNLQEFVAGTDPTNTASVLRLSTPEKIGTWLQSIYWDEESQSMETGQWLRVEAMIFTWNTLSGRVYRLNSTTNLLNSWEAVSPDFVGGAEVSFTNWSTNTFQRFYRLGVEVKP